MEARGGCWSRGIGTFRGEWVVQGESPRINRRLRPFGRWLPTYRPIRTCELARAEKARANAPSIWPPREERHRGVVLFISFFLNFNPSVPPVSHSSTFFFRLVLYHTTSQSWKKFFLLPPLRVSSLQLFFFLPSTPHIFSSSWKLDAGNTGFVPSNIILVTTQ